MDVVSSKLFYLTLSDLGPGGGLIFPNLPKQKLFESVIYNFLTIPKYLHIYFDFKLKKLSFVPLPACWEGFQMAGQDILCIFWTKLHLFWVLFIFYHFRCLNILNFGHWFYFGMKKKLKHFDCCLISERYFGQILPAILYLARARAGQRAHYSKCLNEVYKAYIIKHILYKKF